jgi:hypothetical protein
MIIMLVLLILVMRLPDVLTHLTNVQLTVLVPPSLAVQLKDASMNQSFVMMIASVLLIIAIMMLIIPLMHVFTSLLNVTIITLALPILATQT